jgi:hypothetical protein
MIIAQVWEMESHVIKLNLKNDQIGQIGFLKLFLCCHVIRNKLECFSMASAFNNFNLKSADRERDNYK